MTARSAEQGDLSPLSRRLLRDCSPASHYARPRSPELMDDLSRVLDELEKSDDVAGVEDPFGLAPVSVPDGHL